MKSKGCYINEKGEAVFDPHLVAIEDYFFSGEERLRVCHIPGHILDVGYRAFENCRNLEKLTFEEGVQTVNMEAFLNCAALKHTVLPDSVEECGCDVFCGTGIETPVYNVSRTRLFYYPENLTEAYFAVPDTVREIMSTAFGTNRHLLDLYLPKGVREVEPNAFCDSYLTRVVIPETVQELRFCFRNCPDLTEVILEGETETDEAFENCPKVELIRSRITTGTRLFDLYSPFADPAELRLPADTGYSETERFRDLSRGLVRRDPKAASGLSDLFWELQFDRPHAFFVWAAQFWSCCAARLSRREETVSDALPVCDDYQYGDRLLSGKFLHCLGMTWFAPERLYRFHTTKNPDLVLISSPCLGGRLLEQYDNSHLRAKEKFDWFYADSRFLAPLGETLCHYSFYEPEETPARFLEAGKAAVRTLAQTVQQEEVN